MNSNDIVAIVIMTAAKEKVRLYKVNLWMRPECMFITGTTMMEAP